MLFHTGQTAAIAARKIQLALAKCDRAVWRRHVDDRQAVNVNAEVIHLAQEAVMCGGPKRDGDFLAGEFTGVGFIDFQIFAYDTVVIVGIGNRYVDDLQRLAG